ncbi:MAG TPA: 50S ribosomal protein L9 [Chthoniobacterales bacterium]
MPVTEVILKDNIPNLGAEADIVKVKRGYARNFLIPTGKAFELTPAALRQINNLKAKRAEREARELNEAEDLARRINKLRLNFVLETGATGKAFGSITVKDLADRLLAELGQEIDRHQIQLERPIKESGDLEVPVKLHPEVTAKLKLTVKANEPETSEAGESAEAEAAPITEKRSARRTK